MSSHCTHWSTGTKFLTLLASPDGRTKEDIWMGQGPIGYPQRRLSIVSPPSSRESSTPCGTCSIRPETTRSPLRLGKSPFPSRAANLFEYSHRGYLNKEALRRRSCLRRSVRLLRKIQESSLLGYRSGRLDSTRDGPVRKEPGTRRSHAEDLVGRYLQGSGKRLRSLET